MLIIMSGSAGVGKNTIINELLSEFNNLTLMTTVSTRAMRPGEEQEETLKQAQRWREKGASIVFMDAPLMEISSTQVRSCLAEGRSTQGLLDPRVRAYIDAHGLYRA